MKKYSIENAISTFGFDVKNFPDGVGEAFNTLIKKTGDAAGERNYYGVAYTDDNGKIIYKALAEQKDAGEAEKYNYESYTIQNGEYFTEELKDWQTQTNCIKDIFMEMMRDTRVDKSKPCVEWYKNDKEMLCMMRAK